MVKIYKNGMPVEYTYSDAGKYTLKIAGNLKTASFSGSSDLNNGLATTLVSVETFDKNLKELESNAFNSCKKLQYINLAKSRIVKAGDNAFRNCCALLDMTYNTDLTSAMMEQLEQASCSSLLLMAMRKMLQRMAHMKSQS